MGILVKILLLEGLRALYVLRHRSAGHPNPWAARLGVPAVIEIFGFFFPLYIEKQSIIVCDLCH